MFELEFMEAVKSIAREMRKSSAERADKNPNWEQRRYEIAKELFPVDVLVEELRAPYNKRDYGTGK